MYKKFNRSFRGGGRGGSRSGTNFRALGNRFGQRGGRVVRSFDPTNVINAQNNENINVTPEIYVSKHSFSDFNIDSKLKQNVLDRNYGATTPIQDQSIPEILNGRDLIGIANTGTGKTAAFLIPLLDKVIKNRNEKVLIVAPTRELASQIRDEFYLFSKGLNIYSALCIGGENINRQKQELRRNPSFIIGTPGRLLDHVDSRTLYLGDCKSVVLDEADHMVDIGFLKDIEYMISLLPKERQSLFFSATIDGKVRGVLNAFVNNPVTISVKTRETAVNVKQEVVRIDSPHKKIEQLHDLLNREEFDKVLIFARTKHGVQKLSDELVMRGFRADAIHGNKRQSQRLKTLDKFKRTNINILIATDVASRGLDIPNVSHVINYEAPESYDTYIHRIGRTGRADKTGTAITFV
ncbi:MAG: DEAD/DEAH box helicase [Candidatus Woesebacteria bacterium]|nr:DEAD/DEAH box helicase [Candidatus Woesebacteria bacterium]